MSVEQDNTEHEIHALFQSRWSPRAFDANKEVSQANLYVCLEAARWAPSCFGEEPWRFIVCQRETDDEGWEKLLSCLAPKNQEWAKHAPVLLMVCTHTVFNHNGSENRWSEYDAGAAAISLCLQATSLGLVTHQMGGFDVDMVRKQFAVPSDFKPMTAIALGYQGDVSFLDEGFKGMEKEARKRIGLEEITLFGGW